MVVFVCVCGGGDGGWVWVCGWMGEWVGGCVCPICLLLLFLVIPFIFCYNIDKEKLHAVHVLHKRAFL